MERAQDCIVRVIPYLKPSLDSLENEEYFKQQCQLHIPWRGNSIDLLPAGCSWEELYFDNVENPDPEQPDFPAEDEIQYVDDPLDHAQVVRDAGMASARLHPGAVPDDPLGHRPIDEAYEWSDSESANISEDQIHQFSSFYRWAPVESRDVGLSLPFSCMSAAQQDVLRLCQSQLLDPNHPIKRVIVQGKAGTGKSAVIKAMCRMMDRANPAEKIYEVLAPPPP